MTGPLSPARSADRWFAVLDGVRLRRLRRQHGLSAAELAGKAGVGLSTVTRLERRPRRSCRTRTLARLAAALGQPPTALTCSQPPSADTLTGSAVPRRVLGQHLRELRQQAGLAAQTRADGWWRAYGGNIPDDFGICRVLEDAASDLAGYASCQVPDLLRTEAYARALITSTGLDGREADRLVYDCLALRVLLTRDGETAAAVLGVLVFGVFVGAVGLSPWFALVPLFNLLFAGSDSFAFVGFNGIYQRGTPDAIRGRMFAAVGAITTVASAVSYGFAGFLVAAVGWRPVYVGGSLVDVACAGALALAFWARAMRPVETTRPAGPQSGETA